MDEEEVNSREDIIKYLKFLSEDFKKNKDKEEWANWTIDDFLESMAAWLEDRNDIKLKPSWKSFAMILYAGKVYE